MVELVIYGEIGWENTGKAVLDQLTSFDGEDLTVRVNSPGGDVYEGVAIMNALRAYTGHVTVIVEGLAASAASFIVAGGGDEVIARPTAELMVHDAWTCVDGNAAELQKTAKDLDRMSDNLATIYADKTGGDPSEWREIMREETWYSAAEALEVGLVDRVEDARQPVEASLRQPVFAKAMRRFRYQGRADAPAPHNSRKTMPPGGQEGEEMNFLATIAQKLGMSEAEVRDGLASIRNEEVEVTTPVVVTYPDEVTVVPTGKTVVEPTTPLPEGVEVTAEIGDGFTCEADPAGAVTVHATDSVAVDDTADLVITIGDGTVTVKVTVVPADDDTAEDGGTPSEEVVPTVGPAEETMNVPLSFYKELVAAYELNGKRMEELAEQKRAKIVDGWIAEGRFPAAKRTEVIALMKRDPDTAKKTWGSLAKGSIPRAEAGYGVDPEAGSGEIRVTGRSPFPKVRV